MDVLCFMLETLSFDTYVFIYIYIYIYMNSHIIHKKHVLWMFCVFLWNYVAGIPIFKSTTSRNKFRILYAILVYIYIYIQCEAPKIAKLVYNSNNYGLWYL